MTRPLNFLIVEDEVILAMDMEAMIEEAGHQVVGGAASSAAVETISDLVPPDVALVDVNLAGGSSGIDASDLIRERWPHAVIVFVTANPSQIPEDFAGAHGVVAKPFSRGSFMAAIEYVAEGINDPPPSGHLPRGLEASAKGREAWS